MNKQYISSALCWFMMGLVTSFLIIDDIKRLLVTMVIWVAWFISWWFVYGKAKPKPKDNSSK